MLAKGAGCLACRAGCAACFSGLARSVTRWAYFEAEQQASARRCNVRCRAAAGQQRRASEAAKAVASMRRAGKAESAAGRERNVRRRKQSAPGGGALLAKGAGCKKMPVIFETAILLVLPMPGMYGGTFCPVPYRGGVIYLFRGCHPTLLLSYGTKTRRKPILLFRLSGLLLFRLADRQFSALLFQLPPRITRFEPTIDALLFLWPPWYGTHFF